MVNADASGGTASENTRDERVYTMLENNPDIMNELARLLGVTDQLVFHDVYSIDDPDLLAIIPRPVHALLMTVPMSAAWKEDRDAEDARCEWYQGAGPDEPVLWFQQTVVDGCGLIALLHCVGNGVPAGMVVPGTKLAEFLNMATPLQMDERAQLLKDSDILHEASESVAGKGDTSVVARGASKHHFLALVKGRDNHLWELEGSRKGPLDRGILSEDEDAVSEQALELGIKRLVNIQKRQDGDLSFSCIALCSNPSSG